MTSPRIGVLFLTALLSGCGGRHGLVQTMQDQNFQVPMIDVRDARAIFAGDSITAGWATASKERNTGMPGMGSEIIGRRFAAEIQAGSPRYVHILAGTNDVGGNRDAQSINNISSMVMMARSRNIPVIVGTIPPLDAILFPNLYQQVAPFNASLVATVKPQGAFIADYYSAMVLPNGLQNSSLFKDGIHPNDAGYAVMDKVLHDTKKEMWSTLYTPEQRKAWRAAHPKTYTPEQKAAWKAKHGG